MKTLITIVVLVVVLVGGWLLFRGNSEVVEVSSTATPMNSALETTPATTPQARSITISYTDTGYSPAQVEIKKGDTVIFTNNSSVDMWPASALHPIHKNYPEQSTCFAGVFTNCNIKPGSTFSMRFDQVGAWGFHDHLTPKFFGKITVTE